MTKQSPKSTGARSEKQESRRVPRQPPLVGAEDCRQRVGRSYGTPTPCHASGGRAWESHTYIHA
jgi:hypothetical protein